MLDEALEIHFLDLTQIPKERQNILENWLLFIQTDQQEVRDMIAKTDAKLERANEQMKEFYSIDTQRALYMAAREAESDRVSMLSASKREGIEQGMAQGTYKTQCETASKMKKEKFDINIITRITGLSEEEVAKL